MRHEAARNAPIRRVTIGLLALLAWLSPATAAAQVYLSGGAVFAHVPYRFASGYGGGTGDIAFGGGRHFDFTVGFTSLSQRIEEDPISYNMLEFGGQYRTGGRHLEAVLGASFGWASRGEYDNDGFGNVIGLHARLVAWPFREAGLFAEVRARELDRTTSPSLGLTLGVALRTSP